jgi:Skp family chaperone for outer membrane proteins
MNYELRIQKGGFMKKILFLIIISLFALNAQAAELTTKIGYVDLNKALNESTEGQKAKEELQELVKSSE